MGKKRVYEAKWMDQHGWVVVDPAGGVHKTFGDTTPAAGKARKLAQELNKQLDS